MPRNKKSTQPLTSEEMACLIEGRGTEEQFENWKHRLNIHPDMREEYAALRQTSEIHNGCSGIVEDVVIDKYMEKYFPENSIPIIIKIKEKALQLVNGAGWLQPALQYRDVDAATPGIVNLSKKFDNLVVDVQVVRIKDESLELNIMVEDKVHGDAPSMKVSLIRNERLLNSKYLESQSAQFREVKPGEYSIKLSGSSGEILKVDLNMVA
ncbi:MAG: hypothetical protein HQK83_06700 [Fibrobacteria bacterium]|nr:hypothetical protein [Fibrobacteria bacterium]